MDFHELANFIPMMQPDEFDRLVRDIADNGLLEPIVLYEGKILDGRNRYLACAKVGIEPRYTDYPGNEPANYIISKINRRDLNASQRAMIALSLKPALEKEAEARRIEKISEYRSTGETVEIIPPSKSRDKAGESWGVSGRYVSDAEKIAREAPEYIQPIVDGEITIPKAKKQMALNAAHEAYTNQTRQQAQVVPLVEVADCTEWLNRQPACDLLLTDPPYSTDVDNIAAFANWLPVALNKVKSTGRAYVFIGAYPEEIKAYLSLSLPAHIRLEQMLIWTYKNTLGNNPKYGYKQNYQACLYYIGEDAPELDCPITNEQWAVISENAPDGRLGDRFHTWQKPLGIAEMFVRHSTKVGDVVYDPFTCTGTFLLAAAKLGRVGLGCDISRDNLEIAVERGCAYA